MSKDEVLFGDAWGSQDHSDWKEVKVEVGKVGGKTLATKEYYSLKEWLAKKGLGWGDQTPELHAEWREWVNTQEINRIIDGTADKMTSEGAYIISKERLWEGKWAGPGPGDKGPEGDKGVPDMVNHPDHYKTGGIETLDFVKAKLNSNTAIDHWQAYCFGNAMKYISRAGMKGDLVEDIKKAIFYLRSSIGDDPR